MTDALIIGGWILGSVIGAVLLVTAVRAFLTWLFKHVDAYVQHHVSTALARPLYGDHKTLDQELIELVTKENDHGL
jgi:hypothetical protein